MRIGFVGNTNNYPMMLAMAFRRLGHEVVFVIHRSEPLHRPEFRYPDVTHPYPDWLVEVPAPGAADFVTDRGVRDRTLEALRGCDLVVLNDTAIALAGRLSAPYFVMLTGSDLSYYANPAGAARAMSGVTTRNPLKRLWARTVWHRLLSAQRAAIRNAPLVYVFARGLIPENDALLDGIGVRDDQRIFFLMADVDRLKCGPPPDRDRLRGFCATRLTWKGPPLPGDCPLDFKGSDVMVRGLGRYVRDGGRIALQLVRKGRHVEETVRLAEAEGLATSVTWHDEMTQADVWREYRLADVVYEQFGEGLVSMAGLEAMASGRPVVANGRPDLMRQLFGVDFPVCHATDAVGVCEQTRRLEDAGHRAEVGRRSREWVEANCDPVVIAGRVLSRLGM